jgi:hypothetical protein
MGTVQLFLKKYRPVMNPVVIASSLFRGWSPFDSAHPAPEPYLQPIIFRIQLERKYKFSLDTAWKGPYIWAVRYGRTLPSS